MQILLIHKKSTLCGNNLKSTLKQTGKESAKVKIVVLQQGHYTCLSFINNKLITDFLRRIYLNTELHVYHNAVESSFGEKIGGGTLLFLL